MWDVEKDAWRSFRWDSVKIAYLDEHTDGHVYAEDIEAEVSAIEGHHSLSDEILDILPLLKRLANGQVDSKGKKFKWVLTESFKRST